MIWFLLTILLVIGIMALLVKRNNKASPYTSYMFRYYLSKGSAYNMPIEFLEEWKILHLENHLYILNISLDIDNMIDMLYYLRSIWKDYRDGTITLEVYENLFIEGRIVHKFLGRYKIYKGGLRQVGG